MTNLHILDIVGHRARAVTTMRVPVLSKVVCMLKCARIHKADWAWRPTVHASGRHEQEACSESCLLQDEMMYEGLPLAEFAEVGTMAAHVAGKDGGTASGSDASDQARLIRTCNPHLCALLHRPSDPHCLSCSVDVLTC